MIPTWHARYAVCKDENPRRFVKWHESLELAVEEAKRLCQKEQLPFIVLKEVGCVTVVPCEVEFTEAV